MNKVVQTEASAKPTPRGTADTHERAKDAEPVENHNGGKAREETVTAVKERPHPFQ